MMRDMIREKRLAKGLWWDRAWTLVDGCTHASRGCEECWSEQMAMRFGHCPPKCVDEDGWTGVVVPREDRLDIPLERQKPTVYGIWNDLFHRDVPEEFIDDVHSVMAACPQHRFLVLTKRAARLEDYYRTAESRETFWSDGINNWLWEAGYVDETEDEIDVTWPFNHVAPAVSVEDQDQADQRIPLLRETPAALRWVNLGPLLGPVEIEGYLPRAMLPEYDGATGWVTPGLDWVAVECESGPARRPCELEWVRDVVEQCRAAGVPCWVKQLQIGPNRRVSHDPSEWPEDLRVRQLPWEDEA